MEVYDASGHLVRNLGLVPSTGGASGLLLSTSLLLSDGAAKVFLADASGSWSFGWDGTAGDNSFLPPGVYLVRATYTALSNGITSVKEQALTVSPVQDSIGKTLIAAPNPANGKQPMQLRWTPSGRGATLCGRVYDLAGELVFLKTVDVYVGRLGWDLQSPSGFPIAHGVYIWDVRVRDDQNRLVEHITRKVVILRQP